MKGPSHRQCAASDDDFASLYEAFLSMKKPDEVRRFLADLCTPAEISAFAERWKIARVLADGASSYRDINAETGVSVTTIARVARFLHQEAHKGYALALDRTRHKRKSPSA